ncbi:hypothetical protein A3D55_02405 [Candidatus Jorgensenbacteria bacterium RIFCSPHIGHO2_02_FULL_45_20]|uniref:Uncharacterized protein n=1 Tax=Candidatus Jorgensenbacteria bacterium RIFCSPHIGHO2_02_FULL_45_20 TaxID=1798470 RepID=A0A1F6BPI6_9BACT|nr:MAG: hypothetical protein A3D55_02405 [Candidatus Jorgensenbacteria bacterium RIFCSPHIGHO2_02_FULL_45_20]
MRAIIFFFFRKSTEELKVFSWKFVGNLIYSKRRDHTSMLCIGVFDLHSMIKKFSSSKLKTANKTFLWWSER